MYFNNIPACLAVSIVMGVPSVKREVHSYLTDTLSSLMSELSQAEKEDCVIVVFIAEVRSYVPTLLSIILMDFIKAKAKDHSSHTSPNEVFSFTMATRLI